MLLKTVTLGGMTASVLTPCGAHLLASHKFTNFATIEQGQFHDATILVQEEEVTSTRHFSFITSLSKMIDIKNQKANDRL